MERKVLKDVERFSKEKHIHVPLFTSERTKVLLLCLSAGLTVPPHSHPGFEITLQPLAGPDIERLTGQLKSAPDVPVLPHNERPGILEATRRDVARAGYEFKTAPQ